MQAEMRGLLNPKEFRRYDLQCHQKTHLLLGALERDNRLRWSEILHRHNTAVMQVPDIDDSSFKSAKAAAQANLDSISDKLFPYEKKKEGIALEEAKAYRERYIEAFGDWENDPVAKAKFEATVAMLKARSEEGHKALARMRGNT